jgi:hypothetical protein
LSVLEFLEISIGIGDGDGGVESVAVFLVVIRLDFGALRGRHLQIRQLLPQHPVSVAVAARVVARVDLHAGHGRGGVRHNVAPALAIVDAQRDQEVATRGVREAQHAGGAGAAHGQDVLASGLTPSAVGEHCLLHNAVPVGGVGLDDPHVDRVRHPFELKPYRK